MWMVNWQKNNNNQIILLTWGSSSYDWWNSSEILLSSPPKYLSRLDLRNGSEHERSRSGPSGMMSGNGCPVVQASSWLSPTDCERNLSTTLPEKKSKFNKFSILVPVNLNEPDVHAWLLDRSSSEGVDPNFKGVAASTILFLGVQI